MLLAGRAGASACLGDGEAPPGRRGNAGGRIASTLTREGAGRRQMGDDAIRDGSDCGSRRRRLLFGFLQFPGSDVSSCGNRRNGVVAASRWAPRREPPKVVASTRTSSLASVPLWLSVIVTVLAAFGAFGALLTAWNDRQERFRDRMLDAADDFSSATAEGLVVFRDAVGKVTGGDPVRAKAATEKAWAKRDLPLIRSARVDLLFGPDSDTAHCSNALLNPHRQPQPAEAGRSGRRWRAA